jgi:hypothetical protein
VFAASRLSSPQLNQRPVRGPVSESSLITGSVRKTGICAPCSARDGGCDAAFVELGR